MGWVGWQLPVLVLLVAAHASWARAELYVWVDEHGHTHITDDVEAVPEGRREEARSQTDPLRDLWDGALLDAAASRQPGEAPEGPTERILRAALDDLRRGETARASVALEAILREEPGRPEAHFYLALLDRQRGRFDSAEAHLRAFLAHAGDALEPWRQSAQRRLRALRAEQRLTGPSTGETLRLVDLPTDHFRVQFDAELASGSPEYAVTVVRYLEEARAALADLLGVVPSEPTGVVLYGKAAYLQAHRHRFSFQTVGFFDGRIHVVSAAHPAGELRALLFHEYSHAVFQERSGGHRPFWLNEGFAELAEQRALGRPSLTRTDRSRLRVAIEEARWIPLRELAVSFAGLDDGEARLAYLESTAAAAWIARHSKPGARARLLDRLGQGALADRALHEILGATTDGVDDAVRDAVRAEFPSAYLELEPELPARPEPGSHAAP